MGRAQLQILLVEDDRSIADLIRWALSDAGHEVRCAGSVAEARRLFHEELPDFLLADLLLPDGLGTEIIHEIAHVTNGNGPGPPSLVMSALPQACDYASRVGADACMPKPFDIERLLDTIQDLMDSHWRQNDTQTEA